MRWTLARPGATSPHWTGTETDTKIAYFDRSGIRVLAGDGTGDRLLVPGARGLLAWRPGARFVLAYATAREIRVLDVNTGRTLWRTARRPAAPVTAVAWSSNGKRLLALSPQALKVYDARGRLIDRNDPAEGWPDVDAAFQPGTERVAIARVHGSQSTVFGWRTLFNGYGEFRELEWSPDGRWLLVGWPTADQWVFVRLGAGKKLRAVSNVSEQFRSRSFPRVEGWCCAS
ncbi:hypothetical protein BH09ACT13_BH09ACT13_16600 [soil metagenome]